MVSHGNETSNSVCGEKERSVDRNKRRDIVKSAARRTIRPTLKMMKFEGNGPDGGTVSSTSRVKIKIDKTLEEGTGRWTHEENLQFLIGLKVVGVGQWNKLGGFCPKRSQTQIRSHAQKVLHGIKLKGMKDVSEEQIDKLIQKAKDRISSRIPDTTCLNKVTCIQSASKTTTTTTTMKKKVGIANKAKNGNRGASKSKQKRKFAFLPRKTNKPDPLPISSHVAAALCSLSSHGEIPNDEHCSPAAEAAGALCFLAGLKASSSSSSSPLTPTTDFGDTSSVVAVGALCKLSSPTRTAPTDERRLDAALAICNLVPHSQSPSPGTLQHSRLPAADTSGSSSANSSTIQQVPLSLPIKPNTKRLSSNNRSRKGNNPPAKRVKINHNTTKRKTIAVVSADISSITTALPSITSSTTTEPSTSSQPVPHHIMFVPTREEMLEMRTPRKRNALETWYERFNELYEYKIRHGDTNVPQQYDANHSLGIWVNKQRMEKKAYEKGDKSSMNQKKIILLESIGFVWAKEKGNIAWGNSFEELMAYKKEHGHSRRNVGREGYVVICYICPGTHDWSWAFRHRNLFAYTTALPSATVPTKSRTHRALGRWVSTQRSMYKRYKDGEAVDSTVMERIEKLESVGFVWSLAPGEDDGESSCGSSDDGADTQTSRNDSCEDTHPRAVKKLGRRDQARYRINPSGGGVRTDGSRAKRTTLKRGRGKQPNGNYQKLQGAAEVTVDACCIHADRSRGTDSDNLFENSNHHNSKPDESVASDDDEDILII